MNQSNIAGIILCLMGLLLAIFPTAIWRLSENWKSDGASTTSAEYMTLMRILSGALIGLGFFACCWDIISFRKMTAEDISEIHIRRKSPLTEILTELFCRFFREQFFYSAKLILYIQFGERTKLRQERQNILDLFSGFHIGVCIEEAGTELLRRIPVLRAANSSLSYSFSSWAA